MLEELKRYYGQFFELELLEELASIGVVKEVKKDDVLIDYGNYLRSIPLLLQGVIKIVREDDEGNELLLYFLEKGDTCAMTLSCCVGQKKSEIRATAEVDSRLIMIPIQKMEEWTGKYKTWRNFVFESYHNRLMEMLETVDSMAFLKLDERLLKYLRDKSKITEDGIIQNTHQEIAYDLNTSRVVISRLLKTLENKGIIELHRNKIKLIS